MSSKERPNNRTCEREQRIPLRETQGSSEKTVFDKSKIKGNLEKITKAVCSHMASQKELIATGIFEPYRARRGDAIFSAYENGFLNDFHREAAVDVWKAKTDDEFKRHLDGLAFSKIAYGYLSAHHNNGEIVLSSTAAMDIQKKAYPQAEIRQNVLGADSLDGVYVPDGFIVNKGGLISGVVEYTLSAIPQKLSKQYWGYRHLLENRPEMFASENRFVLVVPNSFKNDLFDENFDVECVKVPISRDALAKYNEVQYRTYRLDDDSPTLAEMRERKHEQASRIKNDLKNRIKITRTDRVYLEKANWASDTQEKRKTL